MYKIVKFLNTVFSETALSIFTRFHMVHSFEGMLTICLNGFAPFYKAAVMPIYYKKKKKKKKKKKHLKSSSRELKKL